MCVYIYIYLRNITLFISFLQKKAAIRDSLCAAMVLFRWITQIWCYVMQV